MLRGLPGFSPNLIEQQQRIASLPSDPEEKALAQHLITLTQQNKVGTPEYFIAAGEYQHRQSIRQQQQANQPKQPPVVGELVAQAAQQVAPIDRGVAALPVGGIGEIGNYAAAGGGIVAFEDGGQVQRFQNRGAVNLYGQYTGMPNPQANVFRYTPEEEEEQRLLKMMSPAEQIRYLAQKYGVNRSLQEIVSGQPTKAAVATTTPAQAGEMVPVVQGTQADVRKADIAAGGVNSPSMPATTPPYMPQAMRESAAPAAAGPAAPSIEAILAQLNKGDKAGIAGLTTQQSVSDIKSAMQEAGYDPEFFKKQIADIEAKKGETKQDKEDAMNMRLVEAGLGILGGESPYAFVNIGKGASPALKGLQEDIKDIRKLNRDYEKSIRDLQVAEQSGNRDIALKAVERRDRLAEKMEDRKFDMAKTIYSGEVQKYVAGMPGAQERIISQLPGQTFGEKFAKYAEAMRSPGASSESSIVAHYLKNPNELMYLEMSNKPEDRAFAQQIRNKMLLMGTVTSPTAPQNVRP